jgi:hypothetical protein
LATIWRRALGVTTRRRETRDSRNENSSCSRNCDRPEQLATADIRHRLTAIVAEVDQVCLTKLIDRERKQSGSRLDADTLAELCIHTFDCPSTFLEKVEYAGCGLIKKMDAILRCVVHKHLIFERVL